MDQEGNTNWTHELIVISIRILGEKNTTIKAKIYFIWLQSMHEMWEILVKNSDYFSRAGSTSGTTYLLSVVASVQLFIVDSYHNFKITWKITSEFWNSETKILSKFDF